VRKLVSKFAFTFHLYRYAVAFAEMAPHARVHIARSLEDTAAWPGLIRDFVDGL
jgi:hypothetical protein